jgi:hypothetical protein
MKKQLFLIFVFVVVSLNFTFAQEQKGNKIDGYPLVSFDGSIGGNIAKADLLKVDSLTVTGGDFTIFSFTFTTTAMENQTETSSSSCKFSPEIKNLIATAKSGSKVFFENIKLIHNPTKSTMYAPAIIFTIE